MAARYSVRMDKLTHLDALRAAARVAFGIAVLGGCTAAASGDETDATESDIKAKKKAEDDCTSNKDAGAKPDAKPSCETVLASAFPDGGDNFSATQNPPKVSDEVKTCCVEDLTKDRGAESWNIPYRWSCCGVLDNWNNPDPKISMACTPWGPPVPPSMKRRARTSLSTMGVA